MMVQCDNCGIHVDAKLEKCLSCGSPVSLSPAQKEELTTEQENFVREEWTDKGGQMITAGAGMMAVGLISGIVGLGLSGGRVIPVLSLIAGGLGIVLILAGLIKSWTGID